MFCIWWLIQRKGWGEKVFHGKWKILYLHTIGLWILNTVNTFVIYSRSDETHLFKIVLYAVPVLFILVYQVEQMLTYQRTNYIKSIRYILALFILCAISTIGVFPRLSALKWDQSVWHSKRLEYLKFFDENKIVQHNIDVYANQAAAYIDDITEDGTPVLNLSDNQLINYNSHTVSVGGKYRFLFYLLSNRFIDRKLFDQLAPPCFLETIFNNSPQIAVADLANSPLLEPVPEFGILLRNQYSIAKRFSHIIVYIKISNGYSPPV